MTYYTDVCDWHRVFGVPVADVPAPLSADRLALRLALMREERAELDEALTAGDVAGAAKEAADEIVTVLGTMAELGVPFDEVWAAVHASNMAKLGPGGEVARRADGKILKPPGWQSPDIGRVLAAAEPSGLCQEPLGEMTYGEAGYYCISPVGHEGNHDWPIRSRPGRWTS